jgi:hypothetical protein
MIIRHTSTVPKEDDVVPRLLYCDSRCSQTCCLHSQVFPGAPTVLSSTPRCSQTSHNHSHDTSAPAIRDPSYSEGWQECSPRVWYSPEIGAFKFTLHILSDTSGGFQWLKYILLMSLLISPHQQNVKWFGSHNSTTQLFWKATAILPEPPRRFRTCWMQNDVPLRYSESTSGAAKCSWSSGAEYKNILKSMKSSSECYKIMPLS